MLLAGEPGIGKTRLAQAGTDRAEGATVSWGACRESVSAPPLWPWMPVLRRLGSTPAVTGEAVPDGRRVQAVASWPPSTTRTWPVM